ncbi:MAG: hypothetical protein Q8S84_01135 [bacterium]|nr:hypothetical protein [bacterium]
MYPPLVFDHCNLNSSHLLDNLIQFFELIQKLILFFASWVLAIIVKLLFPLIILSAITVQLILSKLLLLVLSEILVKALLGYT